MGGSPSAPQALPNTFGGKATIKYNPTTSEIAAGIRQQNALFVWQSPDGQPHHVVVDIGRIGNGVGGPGYPITNSPSNAAGTTTNPLVGTLTGGSGTFPQGLDTSPGPTNGFVMAYRANAQITLGTPGTMQDPFFIDINRGQRFTACASYVAITAQMMAPPGDTVPNLPIQGSTIESGSLVVYATLGVGVNPSPTPVLFTQYIDSISGSQVINNPYGYNLVVPPRANTLLPIIQPFSGGPFQLFFWDAAFLPLGVTQTFTQAAPMTQPIALPQDCYRITLLDKSGLTETYRIVYQLSV